MNHKNIFGLVKYHPKDIFNDKDVADVLKIMFKDWFTYLGIDKGLHEELIASTYDSLKKYSAKTGLIEEKLREKYEKLGVISKIHDKLKGRAKEVYSLVNSFVKGHVLDIGCGPGEIAQMIHDKKDLQVTLTDIVDSDLRKKFAPNLPFILKGDAEKIPYRDNQFGSSLLITVLHHCSSPLFELEEARRVTKGNMIIIESVYGVNQKDTPEEEYKKRPEFYDKFYSLSEEQQRKYGTFLDWFLNKMIIGNEINCPYNFNSIKKWEETFEDMDLELVEKKVLGIDQPVTPEYHILYVVRKKE